MEIGYAWPQKGSSSRRRYRHHGSIDPGTVGIQASLDASKTFAAMAKVRLQFVDFARGLT